MTGSILKDKPSIRSIEQTERTLNDEGITYNEAGVTYNDIRYSYGGVYKGDGRKPTNAKIINL
jgi:hypothetical protein